MNKIRAVWKVIFECWLLNLKPGKPCVASGSLVMTCGLLVPRLVVLGVPVRHLGGGMIYRC